VETQKSCSMRTSMLGNESTVRHLENDHLSELLPTLTHSYLGPTKHGHDFGLRQASQK
jgi:hypothetical protein